MGTWMGIADGGVLVDLPVARPIVLMIRAMGGGGFMCMGHHARGADEAADLRRELRELRRR